MPQPVSTRQRVAKVRARKKTKGHERRASQSPQLGDRESGDHARSRYQKTTWALAERRQWWVRANTDMPWLPHPADTVPDRELAEAKQAAVEALQQFGVLVECSRASGIGRLQLDRLLRSDTGDADFILLMKKARRECQERLEGAFIERGMTKGGDLAGIFYQKHNWKKYREVQRVELTGKDGTPLDSLGAAKADLLARLGKLAGLGSEGSQGQRGLEGKREIVLEKGAETIDIRRPGAKRIKAAG